MLALKQPSPHWQGPIVGAEGGAGTRSLDLGPPPLVRGSMYKKKLFKTWAQIDAQQPQKPPPPLPPLPKKVASK